MGYKRNCSRKLIMRNILPVMMLLFACLLSSCSIREKIIGSGVGNTIENDSGNAADDAAENAADDAVEKVADDAVENAPGTTVEEWIDSVTDERGVYIGQEKEVVGYYKRTGIVKINGSYEDMLKLRDIENRGYLVVNDDGTAFFDLDGEKTEYVFDGANFYLSDDTERANGIHYTCINTRLITDDGETITQYLRLTDEELDSYLKSSEEK